MAQYWKYTEGQYNYRTLTDGRRIRRGMRSGQFVVDLELYVGGFADAEDTGWENLSASYGPGTYTQFREGPRSGAYVLDGYTLGAWEQLI